MSESKNKFSIKEAVSFGWDEMKKNFWFYVLFLLITFVIQGIFSDKDLAKNPAYSIISFLISVLISLATTKVALDAANKKTPTLQSIKEALPGYVNFLITMILYSLITAAGFILLIVPGVIWGIKYSMAGYLVVDKKMSPSDALAESGKITAGHKWQLFLFGCVALLIIIAGGIALGVGLFAAMPTVFIAGAYVYNKLK